MKLALHKAEWFVKEVEFLKVMVRANRVRMSNNKVKAVLEWLTLISIKEVQAFIRFANFYKRFIKHFLKVALPFITKTKKQNKIFI